MDVAVYFWVIVVVMLMVVVTLWTLLARSAVRIAREKRAPDPEHRM
jgi:nitrogen fixation/metabolism regulation signal transduction histidine kinase